jgi:hypothetical protein
LPEKTREAHLRVENTTFHYSDNTDHQTSVSPAHSIIVTLASAGIVAKSNGMGHILMAKRSKPDLAYAGTCDALV